MNKKKPNQNKSIEIITYRIFSSILRKQNKNISLQEIQRICRKHLASIVVCGHNPVTLRMTISKILKFRTLKNLEFS